MFDCAIQILIVTTSFINHCCVPHYNFSYTDTDECAEDSHICDENATCINTIGTFKCECNNGYIGDGKTCEGNIATG